LSQIDPTGGIIEGYVTNAATGAGLVGATVVVFDASGNRVATVQTSAGGRYEVTDLPAGN
jgi:uncharacterized surface anchored protein